MVVRLRDRADRIDLTPHRQRLAISRRQGEIDGGTGAVGRRRGWIGTGRSPEAAHLSHQQISQRAGLMGINAALTTLAGDGVIHHELLHGHWPPGIENRQAPLAVLQPQPNLDLQQALQHALAQPERRSPLAVGGAEGLIGVGLKPP